MKVFECQWILYSILEVIGNLVAFIEEKGNVVRLHFEKMTSAAKYRMNWSRERLEAGTPTHQQSIAIVQV